MITLGVSVWVTPYITYELINKIKDIKNKLALLWGEAQLYLPYG